jgi:sulfoxide reductase heme-binding subunit YedZ
MSDHVFWLISRASGTVALLLSSAAVCCGLLLGGRLVGGRDLRPTHEALSLATLVALVVHAVSLLGDAFMAPSVADLTVPFWSNYQRGWTTLGIVAGWALLALSLSYYWRGRIGIARWRFLHRFTAVAWVLGIVHSLGEGTDAGTAWFLALNGVLIVPALILLAVRHLPDFQEGVGSVR